MNKSVFEKYAFSAQQRSIRKRNSIEERYEKALSIDLKASEISKNHFRVEKVLIFNSLADKNRFHNTSDIDLATQGPDEKYYFRAISSLIDLDPQIKIDLIRLEDTSESLKNIINESNISI